MLVLHNSSTDMYYKYSKKNLFAQINTLFRLNFGIALHGHLS